MRVPWARPEVPTPEPRREPDVPRLLQLLDDGRLSSAPVDLTRAPRPAAEPDTIR